jgi:hypothetical protein
MIRLCPRADQGREKIKTTGRLRSRFGKKRLMYGRRYRTATVRESVPGPIFS